MLQLIVVFFSAGWFHWRSEAGLSGGFLAATLNTVVAFFSVPYFWLIDRHSDSIALWASVLVAFPICWFVIVYYVL